MNTRRSASWSPSTERWPSTLGSRVAWGTFFWLRQLAICVLEGTRGRKQSRRNHHARCHRQRLVRGLGVQVRDSVRPHIPVSALADAFTLTDVAGDPETTRRTVSCLESGLGIYKFRDRSYALTIPNGATIREGRLSPKSRRIAMIVQDHDVKRKRDRVHKRLGLRLSRGRWRRLAWTSDRDAAKVDGDGVSDLSWSPDGLFVSFVYRGDLVERGRRHATSDGSPVSTRSHAARQEFVCPLSLQGLGAHPKSDTFLWPASRGVHWLGPLNVSNDGVGCNRVRAGFRCRCRRWSSRFDSSSCAAPAPLPFRRFPG